MSTRAISARALWKRALWTMALLTMGILACVGAGGVVAGSEPAEKPLLAKFGFESLEIFKIHRSAHALQSADMDGDGRLDLIFANNSEGSVEFLLQNKSPAQDNPPTESDSPEGSEKTLLNEIESDPRFRREKYFAEKVITALRVADFNGDGRPDIAMYSDPAELEIVFQSSSWGADRKKFPIRDGNKTSYALNSGDLNGDGRADLILLGKGKTYIFYQRGPGHPGGLEQPIVLRNAAANVTATGIADLDGDGRADLINYLPERNSPALVRLQTDEGFGPLIGTKLRPISAWHTGLFRTHPMAESKMTLLTVERANRRIKLYRWAKKVTEAGLSSPRLLPQRTEGDPGARGRSIADVDGDGRLDIVTSYPETAQLEVYFQDSKGSHSRRETYPTLAAVSGLALGDLNGDGKNECVVASRKEKILGVSRWEGDRLLFPRAVDLPEAARASFDPLLVALAPLSKGARASIFVISEEPNSKFRLRVLSVSDVEATSLSSMELDLGGTAPTAMRLLDANGDGLRDLMVFVPYSDPYLYIQKPLPKTPSEPSDKSAGEVSDAAQIPFEEISRGTGFGIGQLTKLTPSALTFVADADELADAPKLLVASEKYVRALRLDKNHRLQVIEQFSGNGGSTKYIASALIQLDETKSLEVVLYNQAASALEILERRDNGTYSLRNVVELPSFELVRLEVADMNSDGRRDLVLVGKQKIGLLFAQETQQGFEEIQSYTEEQKRDLGQPRDLILGDFNSDGTPDLVINTSPRYYLCFVTPNPAEATAEDGGKLTSPLERLMSFRMFEEKTYMRRATNLGPRVMLAGDFNGDSLDDLVLLIHDRILLYLQDSVIP